MWIHKKKLVLFCNLIIFFTSASYGVTTSKLPFGFLNSSTGFINSMLSDVPFMVSCLNVQKRFENSGQILTNIVRQSEKRRRKTITVIPTVNNFHQEVKRLEEKNKVASFFSLLIPPPPQFIKEEFVNKSESSFPLKLQEDVCQSTLSFDSFTPPPPPPSLLGNKDGCIKCRHTIIPPQLCSVNTAIDYNQLASISFASLLYFYQMFSTIIFIDLEATGLGTGHRITEIACVKTENFQRTGESFQSYVNPERNVSHFAYQLTGYTQNFLSKYPVFKQIAPHFLKFIKDSILILHGSHHDCFLFNNALRSCDPDKENYIKLDQRFLILDTFKFAQRLHPTEKKDLTSLCNLYGINTQNRDKHGARIDAELLTQLFFSMMKNNKYEFPNSSNWDKMPKIEFFKKFESVKGTEAEQYFRNLGIKSDLPLVFRYAVSVYHNALHSPYPVVLIPFQNSQGEICGVLVKYFLPPNTTEIYDQEIKVNDKYFYGSAENGLVTVRRGSPKTIIIGNMMNALIVNDILLENEDYISSMLDVFDGFTINACLDLLYLPSLEFDISTREIIILLDDNMKNNATLKAVLTKYIDRFCNHQYFTFFGVIEQIKNLKNFMVKYNNYDWTVVDDCISDGKRAIKLIRIGDQELTINLNFTKKEVTVNNLNIDDPNTAILFATPKVSLKVIVLKTENESKKPLYQIAKDNPEKIVQRICSALQINNVKDIEFLERQELALTKYNEALQIEHNSLVIKYLTKRGITCEIPNSYRWCPRDYHYIFKENFPSLIVPLFNNKNIMVGIHRIFFREDGSALPKFITIDQKKKKLSTKLSIGKTVNAASEVYRCNINENDTPSGTEEANVILVSEGMENALIIKQVMERLRKEDDDKRKQIFNHLNIDNVFSIKACVGINGLIDVPLENKTRTIIILADNDGFNVDAKQTMRKTVEYFLDKGFVVKIVLPKGAPGQKIDINDVFLQKEGDGYENIYKLLFDAIQIKNAIDLGEDTEPLQDSLMIIYTLDDTDWEYPIENVLDKELEKITSKTGHSPEVIIS